MRALLLGCPPWTPQPLLRMVLIMKASRDLLCCPCMLSLEICAELETLADAPKRFALSLACFTASSARCRTRLVGCMQTSRAMSACDTTSEQHSFSYGHLKSVHGGGVGWTQCSAAWTSRIHCMMTQI